MRGIDREIHLALDMPYTPIRPRVWVVQRVDVPIPGDLCKMTLAAYRYENEIRNLDLWFWLPDDESLAIQVRRRGEWQNSSWSRNKELTDPVPDEVKTWALLLDGRDWEKEMP